MKGPKYEGPIVLVAATIFWVLVAFVGKLL